MTTADKCPTRDKNYDFMPPCTGSLALVSSKSCVPFSLPWTYWIRRAWNPLKTTSPAVVSNLDVPKIAKHVTGYHHQPWKSPCWLVQSYSLTPPLPVYGETPPLVHHCWWFNLAICFFWLLKLYLFIIVGKTQTFWLCLQISNPICWWHLTVKPRCLCVFDDLTLRFDYAWRLNQFVDYSC